MASHDEAGLFIHIWYLFPLLWECKNAYLWNWVGLYIYSTEARLEMPDFWYDVVIN